MPLLAIGAAATALMFWALSLGTAVKRGQVSRVRILQVTVWLTVASGSLITVFRRGGAPGVASIIVAVGTVLILFIGLVALSAHQRGSGGLSRALLAVTTLLTIVEVIYLITGESPLSTHVQEVASIAFLPLFIYLVYQSKATRSQLLNLAAHAASAVTVGSVALAVLAPDLAYSHNMSDTRRLEVFGLQWRLGGFTPHPNLLSITALVAIVLIFAVRSKLRWLVLVISILALGLAESRVAIASLGLVLVVGWLFRGGSVLGRTALSLPVLAILMWLVIDAALSDEAGAFTSDVATNGRLRVWSLIEQQFALNPLTGYGPLAFQSDSGSPYLEAGLLHAHNQVLQGVAEAGIAGGLLTLAILVLFVALALQRPTAPAYPALVTAFIASSPTEPFLSLHLYGLNYAVVPALLFITAIMSADADISSDSPMSEFDRKLNDQLKHDVAGDQTKKASFFVQHAFLPVDPKD